MTKWNTAVGDTFVSHTSLKLLTVSILFVVLGVPLIPYNWYLGKLPPHFFAVFLKLDFILLSLCGTSNRPCDAVHGPFSHT